MLWFLLFVFGAAIGSFLNVVSMRYNGERFVFDHRVIGGRSHCPHCGKTLQWFELVPILSFAVQGGCCRNCKVRLSFQYPIVEILSGLVFALVPFRSIALFGPVDSPGFWTFAGIWVLVFEILLLISVIDVRLMIIPDELNFFLVAAGIFAVLFAAGYMGEANNSLLGSYGAVFGMQNNFIINRILAAAAATGFFALLVLVTRGKGMGVGDVKLAAPMGILFGWPDVALATGASFVIGAVFGLLAIMLHRKTMKTAVPFGPFLALGGALVFFFGFEVVRWYFHLAGF